MTNARPFHELIAQQYVDQDQAARRQALQDQREQEQAVAARQAAHSFNLFMGQVANEAFETANLLYDHRARFDERLPYGPKQKQFWPVWRVLEDKQHGYADPLYLDEDGQFVVRPVSRPVQSNCSPEYFDFRTRNMGKVAVASIEMVVESGRFTGQPDPEQRLQVVRNGLVQLVTRKIPRSQINIDLPAQTPPQQTRPRPRPRP